MTFSRKTRLAILFISTIVVGACTANTSMQSQAESYIASHIADLSPRIATQGNFRVNDIEWSDSSTVRVTYTDDAGVELHGIATIDPTGAKLVSNFRIDTSMNGSSSSSSSDMMDSSLSSSSSITGSTDSSMSIESSIMSSSSVSSAMNDSSTSSSSSY